MRVFVLNTGRCGSTTFARSCRHMTNFTAAHESNANRDPGSFLQFADQHIEVNNRLSWFLGPLHERYPDAKYVHLRRDDEQVAHSFATRWNADWLPVNWRTRRQPLRLLKRRLTQPYPGSIGPMFAYSMMMHTLEWPEGDRLAVSRFYVETVTKNIELFLADKPSMVIDLEDAPDRLSELWEWIGAEGDLAAAAGEFGTRHNAGPGGG